MKQKINLRLSLIALLAVLAAAVGVTLVYYGLFQTRVRSDLRTNTRLLAATGVFESLYDGSRVPGTDDALSRMEEEGLRITWISADGSVLYDNDTNAAVMSNHLDRPEIREALTDGEGESMRRSVTMNMNTFYYALQLSNGTVLRVSTEARSITSIFLSALPVVLVIVTVILALCILLGHLLTEQLLRPIARMAEDLDGKSDAPVYHELQPFAEKIRSQHEKILAAAESRQDFTANVSHELKTPLTAISGYAELMENGMIVHDRVPYIANKIHSNADRLLSLISDIIRLSELDHTEVPRQFVPVDLGSLARECCKDQQGYAEKQGIRLTCSAVPANFSADRDLIRELVSNLISNAIRYNRENGTVWVEVTCENGHPILTVRDTGIGIPANQQERIFERFYRVDKSRSRETGGTGLGLAIVKHIAEIHHAQILLDSTPEKGSRFTVKF